MPVALSVTLSRMGVLPSLGKMLYETSIQEHDSSLSSGSIPSFVARFEKFITRAAHENTHEFNSPNGEANGQGLSLLALFLEEMLALFLFFLFSLYPIIPRTCRVEIDLSYLTHQIDVESQKDVNRIREELESYKRSVMEEFRSELRQVQRDITKHLLSSHRIDRSDVSNRMKE